MRTVLQGDLHTEEPDVGESGAGAGRLAAERVHVELTCLLDVAYGDGQMEDGLHKAQAYGCPCSAAQARPAPERTQSAMASGAARWPGWAA